jgi:hypothetical protein
VQREPSHEKSDKFFVTFNMSRLVICGSSDWDIIGRKKSSIDYPGPVVYSQSSNLNLKAAISSNSSVHCVLIDGNKRLNNGRGWSCLHIRKK